MADRYALTHSDWANPPADADRLTSDEVFGVLDQVTPQLMASVDQNLADTPEPTTEKVTPQ